MSGNKKTAGQGLMVRKGRKSLVLGGAMVALMAGSSSALAENCTFASNVNVGGVPEFAVQHGGVAGNIASAIKSASTAFLLQSTAFVSGPPGAQPDQQGSGVWTRAVGGRVEVNSSHNTVIRTDTIPSGGGGIFAGQPATGNANCTGRVSYDFVGFQVGHDIARLNWNGWNVHWGTTAGYIDNRGSAIGGNGLNRGAFNTTVESPFAGTYLAVNRGGFFADALLRAEAYQATLNSPSVSINNQNLNARGYSVAASAGYQHVFPNRVFLEPSAGIVYSRTRVDAFNTIAGNAIQGSFRMDDIESLIGRLGLRLGTTVQSGNMIWQPFVSASVWHDFADAPTGRGQTCTNCSFITNGVDSLPFPTTTSYTGTSLGTYGQYSVGVSGQVPNTGWVGFARVDYRQGSNIESLSGTGGIRYHFVPELAPAVMVGKSPVKAAPMVVAYNWTGFYIGGHAGAAFGWSEIDFGAGLESSPRTAGALAGGQIGYNRQINNWVWGIELDGSWTNLNGSRECRTLPAAPVGGAGANQALRQTTCHTDTDVFATLTARLGFVSGRALWYVKAGGAYADNLYSVSCNINNVAAGVPVGQQCTNAANVPQALGTFARSSNDAFGWTVGYGVEYALTAKWSAKAETSYMDFGDERVRFSDGTTASVHHGILATKIGVNYKLTAN